MTMKIMGGPAKEILKEIEMDEKENFTPAQIERFKNDPEFYRRFVKAVEQDIAGTFAVVSNWRLENFLWFPSLHYKPPFVATDRLPTTICLRVLSMTSSSTADPCRNLPKPRPPST